ncbi:MAG: hypothetical protein IPI63_11840 [Methanothrix sp.]|uniref:hypothetical protein n=1 Tax=Methanothrix sp. TaxID=90426 RepID=UPI0025F31AF2|nr:hypothetical protein [Methanothrix sp.]MBK7387351.1 hypothetical protein [Methanothrix sp.]
MNDKDRLLRLLIERSLEIRPVTPLLRREERLHRLQEGHIEPGRGLFTARLMLEDGSIPGPRPMCG